MTECVYFERKEEKCGNQRVLGLEPVTFMITKDRLRWFGHVECKKNALKRCEGYTLLFPMLCSVYFDMLAGC